MAEDRRRKEGKRACVILNLPSTFLWLSNSR